MKPLNTSHLERPIRSKLFVPGSRPELFPKAMASAADAVSFDLEDAVLESRKGEARNEVARFLRESTGRRDKVVIVRVNALGGDLFGSDIEAVVGDGLDIINLPKVESREDILRTVEAIARAEERSGASGQTGILANIETPKGLRLAYEIASADPRVIGLQIGFTDFSLACGIESRNSVALNVVRLAVRFASAEAGIASYDGAFVDVKDGDGFRAEAEEARDLGCAGKSCIHPSQIAIANAVFSPRSADVVRAEALLAAAETSTANGAGSFVHEGKMIDLPILARARGVLTLAAKLGITSER